MPRISSQLSLLVHVFLLLTVLATAPGARAEGIHTDNDLTAIYDPTAGTQTNAVSRDLSLPRAIGRTMLGLGAVLGLMAGTAWAARRWLPQTKMKGRHNPIEVCASRALGARKSLVLVRVMGKTMLLGVSPQAIQCLGEIEPEAGEWSDVALRAGLPESYPSSAGKENRP